MQCTEIRLHDGEQLRERLVALWERTGDPSLRRLADGKAPLERRVDPSADAATQTLDPQERTDWVSTVLMNVYKNTSDGQVFALLFELNKDAFLQAVQSKARRSGCHIDCHDVLQEVFLNIYRYPHRFMAEKADSFRNWGHRIVRNTLLKFLKGETRRQRFATLDEDVGQRVDTRARTPYRTAQDAESATIVDRAYLIYLNLYLMHFEQLSEKERRALTMVEVEAASYKQAAEELGIRLENLKMVIFRGRRKIFRGMTRTLDDLSSRQFTSDSTHNSQ